MPPYIQEASVVKALLVVLAVYAIYALFVRVIFPSMMRKFAGDIQQRYNQQNQGFNQDKTRKKDGEVSITFIEKDKNEKRNPDAGEYVDYEEIK
ncbi:MAG: DUF4834 family protein [Bacteroidales bacterium]